ncbi:MAG: hypothetical protein WCF22_15515 [Candidatus Sulfotelmatobacter sp.]
MRGKKEIEQIVLDAARVAGVPIPDGGERGEEPDFRFQTETGNLGIDVSELLRPACTNHGILPLEQENFHRRILDASQKQCEERGLPPLRVHVYFANPKGRKQDWKNLTQSLVDVVVANYQKAQPAWSQSGPSLPEDFQHVLIVRDEDPWWWSPTVGGISLSQIPMHIASCIAAKEKKLPAYRRNLPSRAEVWLLFHSGVTVARSVEVPHGINEWRFPFEFDRVFWFSFLGRPEFVEIHRAPMMDYRKPWTRLEFVCECGTRCHIDVELDDGQFSGRAYQHPCGTTAGHYVPGRIIRMWEDGKVLD